MNAYILRKIINNNVILAEELDTKDKVVLMAKGIGFGRKVGSEFTLQHDEQIFKLWSGDARIKDIKYDKTILSHIIHEICLSARDQFGIDTAELKQTLTDHITFSIDRSNFGLELEYPFSTEVSILYTQEYEIGKYALIQIQEQLNITLPESEASYIAIHINSARKQNSVAVSMDKMLVYNKIIKALPYTAVSNTFLLVLDEMVSRIRSDTHLTMAFQYTVFENFSQSYQLALQINDILQNDLHILLINDDLAFLTIELEKLRQYYQ